MSKHTPGPWVAKQDPFSKARGDNDPENRIYGANGHPIAVVRTTGMEAKRYEANARLIAAAPKLLEALNGLLQYTGGWDLTQPTHPIVIARAAIAEATEDV